MAKKPKQNLSSAQAKNQPARPAQPSTPAANFAEAAAPELVNPPATEPQPVDAPAPTVTEAQPLTSLPGASEPGVPPTATAPVVPAATAPAPGTPAAPAPTTGSSSTPAVPSTDESVPSPSASATPAPAPEAKGALAVPIPAPAFVSAAPQAASSAPATRTPAPSPAVTAAPTPATPPPPPASASSNGVLDGKSPPGPLESKWDTFKMSAKLIAPNNKRKYTVLVVGTGLAGASAAATLAEQGYNVKAFCFHDSPRRAHSIAAQGGINAAKNYQNDGDSVERLFYDTIKGGDFRAREANVYRLAQVSTQIIDQCVAQGVPFAREYGGLLANRSFGGAQVSRTFYARGQTGQQLLLGAYQALERQIALGMVQMYPKTEMLDIVVIDGHAKGIVVRNLVTGEVSSHAGDTVVLATGGYGNVYYLSTNAKGCNVTATYRAHKKGAYFANPCYTQIHPTCIPVEGEFQSKLTLMSESLRNDGRVWVPKKQGDKRAPKDIPESERDYYLERKYPSYGNLAPRDISSRAAKEACDDGRGVGESGLGVYLDFADSIKRLGVSTIRERYGNLFDIYRTITGEDAYTRPMRIFPAVHYTMGGLWVDYNLMSNLPGLHVLGEANFSDHGANRLGASALMQGLADGYFVLPYTLPNYLATVGNNRYDITHRAFVRAEAATKDKLDRMLAIKGKRTVTSFHRELGLLMWDKCGMARNEAGLKEALEKIPELRAEFWRNVNVPGGGDSLNQSLELAGRVADFLEFGELMCRDALHRAESCGGHFREESQTEEGEALRDDANFTYVAAWEHKGENVPQELHKEPLNFEKVHLAQRSYK